MVGETGLGRGFLVLSTLDATTDGGLRGRTRESDRGRRKVADQS